MSPKLSSSSEKCSGKQLDGESPRVLTDSGIDFTQLDKQQKEFQTNLSGVKKEEEEEVAKKEEEQQRQEKEEDDDNDGVDDDGNSSQTRVIVLSYPRYCRYRALLRRLEGTEPLWLSSSIAAALGGFTALPGTKVLFCRDTFDYPDLETHELLCNHLGKNIFSFLEMIFNPPRIISIFFFIKTTTFFLQNLVFWKCFIQKLFKNFKFFSLPIESVFILEFLYFSNSVINPPRIICIFLTQTTNFFCKNLVF